MRPLLSFGLLSLACALLLAFRLELRTAITDFLPRDDESALLDLARELSRAPQSKVVVVTVGAEDEARHVAAARELAQRLVQSGKFEWVRSGISSLDETRLYELYFPARLGLLELPAGDGPVPDAYLDARLTRLKERLAGPLGVLERRLAPDDPLGAFTGVLERQARARGQLRLSSGQLVSDDGRHSVLFAATRAPAFDGGAQAEVERLLEAAEATLRAREPSLELEWTGVNRFALSGERSVRGDIERVSLFSLFGIFLLYFGVFRSLREPLLVLLPIGFGCLLATAICQLAFGFVHGLALAFGSSIIGVAEDYSTHYFAHRIATPASEDNQQLMRRLWPGMLMGGATTIAGIAMLFGSGFPGLQQMATFGAVGVLGALLATRYVLPVLSRRVPSARPGRLTPFGQRLVRRLEARPIHALWFVAPGLVLAGLGLPRAHFDDTVGALRTPDPALEAENRRVQERLGRSAESRTLIALGATDEQALARAEQLHDRLEEARAEGLVDSYRSVAELVPSLAKQAATRARLAQDASFVPRFEAALARHGFTAAAFAPFVAALGRDFEPTLSPRALQEAELGDLIAPFRAELPQGIAYLTPVQTDRPTELAARVAGLPGIAYLDQEALFGAAYGRFRSRVLTMVSVGLLLVLGILLARYRDLSASLLGLLPALLGAAASLGLSALLAIPLTLMHVIAVLLVLSMGVDYGIYALESRASVEEGATTLGSVLLAALTTVLSFGLLGVSQNPALAAVGTTVGFGMVFTVLASPVVLALAGRERT